MRNEEVRLLDNGGQMTSEILLEFIKLLIPYSNTYTHVSHCYNNWPQPCLAIHHAPNGLQLVLLFSTYWYKSKVGVAYISGKQRRMRHGLFCKKNLWYTNSVNKCKQGEF